ncbi:regulatory particle non-ATPase [Curvularia kusanoi]|uniref:DNA replication regulator SLD2 n=1 Tax=Curvularia kusanoi TaxID=90978 RepID=A0A9P4TPK0_CURKU|nr:regulatory particle non-ATPase [Curvularia kusanoi]
MSITEYEQRCTALRNDLKAWEKQFAAQHNGKKAGREDIKADAIISQKYKEYNKLRTHPPGAAAPQTPSKRATSRKQADNIDRTPKVALKAPVLTPLKRKRTEEVITENADTATAYLSPQGPAFIGPTPQRDGIVLGLFDNLTAGTPSKRRIIFGEIEPNLFQTPTKKDTDAASEASSASRIRGERTPLSVTKRNLFNQFVTPKKRKVGEEGTPTSTLKGLATPAFLRRDNVLDRIEETNEATPRPAPWKKRGMVRSLSAMIQNMRKEEDDRLDEEADIMREMEMEEEGIRPPVKPRTSQVQVTDSQAEMPLGPDRGSESEQEEEEEEELGPDGKPKRVWKKKGLKRQTRRTNLRPNAAKPKPVQEFRYNDEESDNDSNAKSVPETQLPEDAGLALSADDDDDSDYASDVSHSAKKQRAPTKKEATLAEKKEGVVEKVKRKISATAHANYQRLKIRGYSISYAHVNARGACTSSALGTPPELQLPPPPPAATNTTTSLTSLHATSPIYATRAPLPTSIRNPQITPVIMAEKELHSALQHLHQTLQSRNYQQATTLLSKAKMALLQLNALIPQAKTPKKQLQAARETLELGAIISIRLKDTVSFTRYFQQLQPFYALPASTLPKDGSQASKVTGLYLLLLLSEGDYAGFHTLLETLEVAAAQEGKGLEDDQFIQYPIRLEQALMEGSYDRVWGETKSERVPSEEFGMFSEILIGTIRKEIASCSERAYPSIPISDAKSLLFLDSEGSVVNFARESGWVVKDGRIYFPQQEDDYQSKDILVTSDQVIENTLGYARELEMIV